MNTFSKLLTLAAILSTTAVASAAETDVELIVSRANHVAFYQAKDGRAESRMLITDGSGNKQVRQFTILDRKSVV